MKRAMVFLGLVLVVMVAPVAEANAAGDFRATLGLKGWYNSWGEEYPWSQTDSVNVGSSLMVGPSLTLRYKKVFVGASYLLALSKYELDSDDFFYEEVWDRQDLDLTAGVMFVPSFGMFVGYKSIHNEVTADNADYEATMDLRGPGIGVLGNIPLGRYVAVYGNLAVMTMTRDYSDNKGGSDDYNMLGASGELGLAVAFNSVLSASLGWKMQSFQGDDSAGNERTSTFKGLTFGFNATF